MHSLPLPELCSPAGCKPQTTQVRRQENLFDCSVLAVRISPSKVLMKQSITVKGAKSVEVRPVGISKGLAMSRIINAIAAREAHEAVQYDFVLVAGHFLVRDENIFTFFEGQSLKVSLAPIVCCVLSLYRTLP